MKTFKGDPVADKDIKRKLAAILSADAVGYTRLMTEDEVATLDRIKTYRELIAIRVKEHNGRVVNAPGDNILAEFPSALDATRCAVEIQRALQDRNADLPEDRRMAFRTGIHLGDVMLDGGGVYGDGVNIAARLEELADPGGLCISAEVYGQVHQRLHLQFENLGEQTVKNISDPIGVYRVQLDSSMPAVASTATRIRMKVAVMFAVLLAIGISLVVFLDTDPSLTVSAKRTGPPVVVLMDTAAPKGVYDEETLSQGGTNADVLNDVLRDLPVVLYKETLTSTWVREEHIANLRPDLIVIHRSAFFHSMNREIGFGYPPFKSLEDKQQRDRLYRIADNKLMAFFGYVGNSVPELRVLVYSRGTGDEWEQEEFRRRWVSAVEDRFSSLKGRIHTMNVPGEQEHATFRSSEASRAIRANVQSILSPEPVSDSAAIGFWQSPEDGLPYPRYGYKPSQNSRSRPDTRLGPMREQDAVTPWRDEHSEEVHNNLFGTYLSRSHHVCAGFPHSTG